MLESERVHMPGLVPTVIEGRRGRPVVAVVGGHVDAAEVVRLLAGVGDVVLSAVCVSSPSSPAVRVAEEAGAYVTRDLDDLLQIADLDVVIDLTGDADTDRRLREQLPKGVEVMGPASSQLVRDLLREREHGLEQARLVTELQSANEKVRLHERRLEASKAALERANEELERRLAEIFFTHEFFKALTSFTSVPDVCSLIVDGCNGILGAEISAVYLLDRHSWLLELCACQGRPDDAFVMRLPVDGTILGKVFEHGAVQEVRADPASGSAGWMKDPAQVVSQIAVPLRTGDTIFGVMVIASSEERELSVPEMDRLQTIGNQSSLSLQNALLHAELERLSVTDRLTELYNHGYFQQRLEEELNRAERFQHVVSLVMIDIDDFKEFNDRYGHPCGDAILKSVSATIRANLRDIDVAARYGGEEFVVVLPETDMRGAAAVAERIRDGIHKATVAVGNGVHAGRTVSVGVATFPTHAMTPAQLISAADVAMYRAKRAGKNRVEFAAC